MCTEMEKDVLIEYVGGAIAMIKNDNQVIEKLKKIRSTIYSTSYKKLNYKALSQEIKELRKPYKILHNYYKGKMKKINRGNHD